MDTVLVTGGTGHLGRDLVARLKGSYRVRVLARSPGSQPGVEWVPGDLATGEGIADALAGSQTVIHARRFPLLRVVDTSYPKTCGPALPTSIGTARRGCWKGPPRQVSATLSTCRSSVSTERGFRTCGGSWRPRTWSVQARSLGRSPARPSSIG